MLNICANILQTEDIEAEIALLSSNSRKAQYVLKRKMCCIALKNEGYSYEKIGELFNRDRCSVIHLVLHSKWHFNKGMAKGANSRRDLQKAKEWHLEQANAIEKVLNKETYFV